MAGAVLAWAVAASAALGVRPAAAQVPATITGRVLSPAGDPVAGATVEARRAGGGPLRRARTGAVGDFRITGIGAGTYVVRASRLGYQPVSREVAVGAGEQARVDLRLAEEALVLAPVEVRSPRESRRERTRFETEAGVTTRVISGEEIKALPGLGEADVLRAIEVLPGVVHTSDFTSAFNVRGGSADQNLILLDGFTIFNPFHLGGLFSVFNADVIARAELLAGGFGAEYGGRVSSVLSVETEATGGDLSGETGVSLLASRLALHGSLPAGAARTVGGRDGSWMLSARRSYFDAVLRPVTDFPYHLTDVQLGAAVETGGGGRLQLTGYIGEDVLDLSDFDPPTVEDDEESILRLRWNWGNDVAGLRWTQPVGRWVADTRLGFSRYAESLSFPDFADTRFTSRIQEGSLRTDFARQMGSRASVKTGGELVWMENRNLGEAGGTTFFYGKRHGFFGAAYLQARWQPTPGWIVEPGLRADVAGSRAGGCARPDRLPGSPLAVGAPLPLAVSGGSSCVIFSPRLAVKRFLGAGRDAALKLAVGRYVQWLHSVRDEQLPLSNDTWIIASEHFPPVVSDQVQVGLEKYWGEKWYASTEAYYRTYEGVTDFNLADDTNDPSDDLLVGRGHSYGLDVLVRRSEGRLTGWTTISLLRAERTFPDPLAFGLDSVPQTVTFSPVFDRRVDVDVVMQYALPARFELGARWNYGTGTPYTRPVAQYVGFETDIAGGAYRVPRPVSSDPEVPVYIVPGDRNRERYP
ncbi:MAG TPA: TonB-dependent receptor, partial [Longimicrobium sp.]|nr:TonB-dependent receptor [Longimicrobium sp.]